VSTAARVLGRYQGLPRHRRWATLASLVWVVVVTSYAIGFFGGEGAAARGTVFIDGLFFLIALILPLMLVWLAAWLAGELERQREVIAALAELTPPLIEAMQATRATLERHAPATPEAIEAAIETAVRQGLAATSAASREIDPRPALTNLAANQARMEGALRELLGRAPPPAPQPEPTAPEPTAPASAHRRPAVSISARTFSMAATSFAETSRLTASSRAARASAASSLRASSERSASSSWTADSSTLVDRRAAIWRFAVAAS
jgi:hypothetical protein